MEDSKNSCEQWNVSGSLFTPGKNPILAQFLRVNTNYNRKQHIFLEKILFILIQIQISQKILEGAFFLERIYFVFELK